jgi:hypothetical protein
MAAAMMAYFMAF